MADVSGFTALSERLAEAGKEGAEKLTDVINRFFTRVLDAAVDLDGDVLTFAGDAVLILFRGEDHAGRAASAGPQMLGATSRVAAVDVAGRSAKLGMSIGIHAGSFLTVATGDPEQRMQLMFVGPETEMVAKAEQVADQGQVGSFFPSTAFLLGDRWTLADIPDVAGGFRLVDWSETESLGPPHHGYHPVRRGPGHAAPGAVAGHAVPRGSARGGAEARLVPSFLPGWPKPSDPVAPSPRAPRSIDGSP